MQAFTIKVTFNNDETDEGQILDVDLVDRIVRTALAQPPFGEDIESVEALAETPTTQASQATYLTEVTVQDVTGADVTVEIYFDPISGSLFGIDASFDEDVSGRSTKVAVFSPYNAGHILELPPQD